MAMATQSKRVKAKQPYKKHLSSKIGAFIFGEFERRKTDVIDMGEKHLDSNRKWWDSLSMNANSDELIKYIEEKYRVIVLE